MSGAGAGLLLAAALAAAAAGLAVPGARTSSAPGTAGAPALRTAGPGPDLGPGAGPAGRAPADPPAPRAWPARLAGGMAGVAAWLLLGGSLGALAGLGIGVIVPVVVARLEPAAARRRRLALVRAAPLVADLLAAALAAGVPLESALPVVARAVGEPAGSALHGVHDRVGLGMPAEAAWSALLDTPGLAGIARTVARSARTGAPLAVLLSTTAADLRAHATAEGLAEVRATSVRAVLPLGLCLLPAFALLGVVPVVAGLLPSL